MIDFPDPLFETAVEGEKLCLVCARRRATRALWTVKQQIVPMCDDCRADWNLYGYLLLKRVKPGGLVANVLKYKLLHPFQPPSIVAIWRDVREFQEWAARMQAYLRAAKTE